jgi:hypothetical protein
VNLQQSVNAEAATWAEVWQQGIPGQEPRWPADLGQELPYLFIVFCWGSMFLIRACSRLLTHYSCAFSADYCIWLVAGKMDSIALSGPAALRSPLSFRTRTRVSRQTRSTAETPASSGGKAHSGMLRIIATILKNPHCMILFSCSTLLMVLDYYLSTLSSTITSSKRSEGTLTQAMIVAVRALSGLGAEQKRIEMVSQVCTLSLF